ncbi:hypothetical protein L9F63_004504 [Diploptera punctata]|uniref:Uncharacterized protein n=1 Tax=Diploptera punctata TaxID=6984 RepID=A0AAD7ZGE0_DIPPU|nr:hypothetical protein L9F63_004504 [Diploptera punctata]
METVRGDSGYDADLDDIPEPLTDRTKMLRRKITITASTRYKDLFSYSCKMCIGLSHSLGRTADIETSDKEKYIRPRRPSKKKGKKKKSVKWQDISV